MTTSETHNVIVVTDIDNKNPRGGCRCGWRGDVRNTVGEAQADSFTHGWSERKIATT
jgi:hypothetical protein